MSARGLCCDCAADRNARAQVEMVERDGPFYDEWVRGTIDFARSLDPR